MGVVYLAREVSLERRVALKLLTPDRALQPNAKERFLQEARTAAQLWHPGIIPIFTVDEVRDFVFFAMAYVEGQTLGQRVRGDGPLSYTAVARMLKEVARALDYAHAKGVVHRDVKPDNILMELRSGRALVADFGIARVNGGGSTGPRRARRRSTGARRWPSGRSSPRRASFPPRPCGTARSRASRCPWWSCSSSRCAPRSLEPRRSPSRSQSSRRRSPPCSHACAACSGPASTTGT